MKNFEKMVKILLLVLLLGSAPAWGQTPQDSAAERARSQSESGTADQASPGATQGTRKMLQDTGGKSGVSGIGKADADKAAGQNHDKTDNFSTRNHNVVWGIVIVTGIVLVGLMRRSYDNK